MKVRYLGETFGGGYCGLTGGKIYECLGVELGWLRIIDDEGLAYWEKADNEKEGYLYNAKAPAPLDQETLPGRFEIIEDDELGTLRKAIYGQTETVDDGELEALRNALYGQR